MKKIYLILAFLLSFSTAHAAATLWEFYNGDLPTIEERAMLYTGSDEYVGSAEQNIQLLAQLEGGSSMVLGAFNPVQAQYFTLYGSGISLSATSIILTSFKLPDGSTNITMSDLGTIGYATIEPGTSREEHISFTGVTQNANGTATLTGVTRGLAFTTPYAETSANKKSHAGGSKLILSNTAGFYTEFAKLKNAESITGVWTFSSTSRPVYDGLGTIGSTTLGLAPIKWVNDNFLDHASTAARTLAGVYNFTGATSTLRAKTAFTCDAGSSNDQVCDKAYIDSTANAGASDANYTTKGIAERATTAEIDAGTSLGGTSAALFINPLDFASSKWASTTMASSTTATGFYSIPVKANDILMIWAKSAGECQAADALYLYLKQSTMAATSTVDVTSCDAVDADYFGLSTMYAFSATTTETINLLIGGIIAERKIMFLKLPFNTAF